MPSRSDAEEHLRVIRSLMERATFYRAIAAPAAAIGGSLAIVASFAFGSWLPLLWPAEQGAPVREVMPGSFTWLWTTVLVVTASVNFLFLWRDAQRRGDPFVSPGMKFALRAVLPSYVVAAFWTWQFSYAANPTILVPVWLICHGVALLATGHFAPRSLVWLGWAFLIAGLALIDPVARSVHAFHDDPAARLHHLLQAQMWMASTFGLFHLIYAACAWPRVRMEPAGMLPTDV